MTAAAGFLRNYFKKMGGGGGGVDTENSIARVRMFRGFQKAKHCQTFASAFSLFPLGTGQSAGPLPGFFGLLAVLWLGGLEGWPSRGLMPESIKGYLKLLGHSTGSGAKPGI